MNTEDFPRQKRKPVTVVRVSVRPLAHAENAGEAWATIDDHGQLISVGADISEVTTAAFRAGYAIQPQQVEA